MSTKHKFPNRRVGTGLLVSATSWTLLANGVGSTLYEVGFIVAGGSLVILPLFFWVRGFGSTHAIVEREEKKKAKSSGIVTPFEHLREMSALSLKLNFNEWNLPPRANVLRPSLGNPDHKRWTMALRKPYPHKVPAPGGMTRCQALRVPPESLGFQVAKHGRRRIWASGEDVTARFGGPRMGKTAELACVTLGAPGACVVTSTRNDLAVLTAARRQKVGPTHIFDPTDAGGLGNTVKWPVLTGCRNPKTARRRARDMVPVSTDVRSARWDELAQNTLAVLMHAAALSGEPLRTVLLWSATPEDPNTRKAIMSALRKSPGDSENAKTWEQMANQFLGNNHETRSSITTTLNSKLYWLLDSQAAQAGDSVDGDLFDIPQFLAERGTMYMIGSKSDQIESLFAALTGEIAYQARRIASRQPGGRLDPFLTLVLDEVTAICPVPLPDWTQYFGGHGIPIHIAAHSPADLVRVWGQEGAQAIMAHCALTMVYGGIADRDALAMWVEMMGKIDADAMSKDAEGKVTGSTERAKDIISIDRLRKLRKHQALLMKPGVGACIVKTANVYKRRDLVQLPVEALPETNGAEDGLDEKKGDEGQ